MHAVICVIFFCICGKAKKFWRRLPATLPVAQPALERGKFGRRMLERDVWRSKGQGALIVLFGGE